MNGNRRSDDKRSEEKAGHTISGGQHEDATSSASPRQDESQERKPDLDYHGLLLYGPADRSRNPPSPFAGSSTGAAHKGGSGSAGTEPHEPAKDATHPLPGAPADQRIARDLNTRLAADAAFAGSRIDIQVTEGIVMLTGTVTRPRLRHLAGDIAGTCEGVREIRNDIVVERSE